MNGGEFLSSLWRKKGELLYGEKELDQMKKWFLFLPGGGERGGGCFRRIGEENINAKARKRKKGD